MSSCRLEDEAWPDMSSLGYVERPVGLSSVSFLHESIVEQAHVRPNETAIIETTDEGTGQETVTKHSFQKLDEDSNRVARMLVKTFKVSLNTETLIGVCLDGLSSSPRHFVVYYIRIC